MDVNLNEAQEIVHALHLFADRIRKDIPAGADPHTVREATTYADSLDAHGRTLYERARTEWRHFTPMPPPGFGA